MKKLILSTAVILTLFLSFTSCKEKTTSENVDEAMTEVMEATEDAQEAVQQSSANCGASLETGRRLHGDAQEDQTAWPHPPKRLGLSERLCQHRSLHHRSCADRQNPCERLQPMQRSTLPALYGYL